MRTVSWMLSALALAGCTATGNKPDATVTRIADGYEVSEFDKAAEKKAPSTHPVDLRLREHYEKERRPRLTGALVFSGNTLTVDVQAVGQGSSSPYPFNGTYRLKTRK
ncbi:hypothetical protein ACFJIS_00955 [Variovorax boronicumulans]|uniref:hypothetical protein n=1 Tax=Variovorax boronicumulans TaxID=436515 RepID=UPI0036F2E7E6